MKTTVKKIGEAYLCTVEHVDSIKQALQILSENPQVESVKGIIQQAMQEELILSNMNGQKQEAILLTVEPLSLIAKRDTRNNKSIVFVA